MNNYSEMKELLKHANIIESKNPRNCLKEIKQCLDFIVENEKEIVDLHPSEKFLQMNLEKRLKYLSKHYGIELAEDLSVKYETDEKETQAKENTKLKLDISEMRKIAFENLEIGNIETSMDAFNDIKEKIEILSQKSQ